MRWTSQPLGHMIGLSQVMITLNCAGIGQMSTFQEGQTLPEQKYEHE